MKLNEHLAESHCHPFPAGPVVPRRETDKPSPWLQEAEPSERAKKAIDFLVETYCTADNSEQKSHLTRAIDLSTQEWASRHKFEALRPSVANKPLLTMTRALREVPGRQTVTGMDPALEEVLNNLKTRIYGFIRRPPKKAWLEIAIKEPCFRAPPYECACSNDAATASDEDDGVLEEQPDAALESKVATLLEGSEGFWTCQTLLFLTLLHGHLGIRGVGIYSDTASTQLYKPVCQLLAQLGATSDDLARTALALRHVLSRLVPFCKRVEDRDVLVVPLDDLPSCFDPRRAGIGDSRPDVDARRWLRDAGETNGRHAGTAEGRISRVVTLAQETASILTDPLAWEKSLFARETAKYLENHYTGERKELLKVVDSPNLHLIARGWRIQSFMSWWLHRTEKQTSALSRPTAAQYLKASI